MINVRTNLFLLAMPIALMGIVDLLFGILSLYLFHDGAAAGFISPGKWLIFIAAFLALFTRKHVGSQLGARDALLYATATWIICGLLGAIPITLITHISLSDSLFESISALTTTGATMLSGLDEMPGSFLLYRQFLQWLGGLGVVVFVVAILPMLNVGAMKLLKAETPGPIKDDKLSPRISKTAHYLWFVYLILTILCCLSYYLAGMSFFDAVAHSMSTVSTGGFSTHDQSLGYFHSEPILLVADVFMILGAISFALHFQVLRSHKLIDYWRNEETRVFILLALGLSLVVFLTLLNIDSLRAEFGRFISASFILISFITSTGYGADNFTQWPAVTVLLLVFAGYLGGCAGSTAGGNKIIRGIISFKSINLQLKKLIHPQGVFILRYQNRSVENGIQNATRAFMSVAALSTMTFTLVLMITGLDFWSSFTASTACLNVLGPAFGTLGDNYQPVSDQGAWVLTVAMLIGRLEYFTVLALLTPTFWSR